MKIAFIVPCLDSKGPLIFTHNLIQGLQAEGCICEVFYFDKDLGYKFPTKTTRLEFWKSYDFSGFDIVHTTMAKPDLYVSIHKIYKKIPCVSGIHNMLEQDLCQVRGKVKGSVLAFIWKHGLDRIKNVIVSSSAQKDFYEHKFSRKHDMYLIPYGIPDIQTQDIDSTTKSLLTELKLKYENIIVGCGNLIKRKGFYQLVNYLEHNRNAALVLIGDGPELDNLVCRAKSSGVEERLVLLGFRTNSYNYYPYVDCYCMTSNSEGFGLAMLEAMCLKKPIVCTDLEIYNGYFNADNTGLFEFGNQKCLNETIDKVLANKDYYANAARELYEKCFSLPNMAKMHIEAYQKMINTQNG